MSNPLSYLRTDLTGGLSPCRVRNCWGVQFETSYLHTDLTAPFGAPGEDGNPAANTHCLSLLARRSTRDVPHHFTLDDVSTHRRIEGGKGRHEESHPPVIELGELLVVFDQILCGFIHEHGYPSAKSTCTECNITEHSWVPEKVVVIHFAERPIDFRGISDESHRRQVVESVGIRA